MDRLLECMQGKNDNYVLPFFWQHGEPEEVLRRYMHVIHDANMREVCLEARPHPDYAGEGWFHDVDIILDEAKKLGMKIWILDDAHFPSGQCAGKMMEEPARLQKQYLRYKHADVTGPVPAASLSVAEMAKEYKNPFAQPSPFAPEGKWYDDDAFLAVVAGRLDGKGKSLQHLDEEILDLTDRVKDGILTWDVPAGTWRIFVLYTTRNNGGRAGYVNFLSRESCKKQIEYCYEPHYKRYKDEFGSTIRGFFSDEPEIGNVTGYDPQSSSIGNMFMPLPWSEEMPPRMEERFGKDWLCQAVALWMPVGSGEYTARIRTGYMDIVTELCQENFGGQIGTWCREHGVEYIGHIVEDNDQHVRLGSSQGHYFRALWGQDWAGVDNICGQVMPGGADVCHTTLTGLGGDGTFYHHVLARLATSLADLDPGKQGRSLCEIFGAYGWEEGTRMMKYELDHFLVRGINHFVPHAFSPKEFPDPDCPPHFYAQGKNPLYKPFGSLMNYANRICHLISGGTHEVKVGILYHAESEWSGMEYMDMAQPARVLDDHQIDADFLPADVFSRPDEYQTVFDERGLVINGHRFEALVIPDAAFIPDCVREFVKKARETGFPVLFADKEHLEELAERLMQAGIKGAVSDTPFPDLQIYHYSREEGDVFLLSNESVHLVYRGKVTLPVKGRPYRYDAMDNLLYRVPYEEDETGTELPLHLSPYEMAVILVPGDDRSYEDLAGDLPVYSDNPVEIAGPWKVSFVKNEDYPDFTDEITLDSLENILNIHPDFSGVIRYETAFSGTEGPHRLVLEEVFESAEVWIGGEYAGQRIAPPYSFDLTDHVHSGQNSLRIEVRTTLERLVHHLTGGVGMYGLVSPHVVPPCGIVGKVLLC